jgi:hypothetical protein
MMSSMPSQRRVNPRIAAPVIAGALVVIAILLAAGPFDRGNPRGTGATNQPAGSPTPSPSGSSHGVPPLSLPAAVTTPQGSPTTEVRFTFDSGQPVRYTDTASRLKLHMETAEGGTLTPVPHGGGLAVGFPKPCATYGAAECERAVLTSDPAPFLNPGSREIRYGATVRLPAEATTKGENLLQKGVSTTGVSQFKLQVDGHAGEPSCVMVGVGSHDIYLARSSRTVADGQWHQLTCVRTGDVLAILMDGQPVGSVSIPATLAVKNDLPLQLGGKGVGPGNDQFNGQLDDVYVEIFG